ncbi:MAG: hypothetical protein R3C61_01245 [Bacteroidia bacterium]
MQSKYLTVLSFCLIFTAVTTAFAQKLDLRKEVKITLKDQTAVVLYPSAEYRNQYYYSPVNLRISIRKDNQPEYSFLTFKENDEGPVTGGLMHIMLTWGLSISQEEEAIEKLRSEVDSTAVIYGALPLEPLEPASGFYIISDNRGAEILRRSLKSSAGPSNTPGGKMAASFMFSADDAVAIEKLMANPEDFKDSRIFFAWRYAYSDQIFAIGTLISALFPH